MGCITYIYCEDQYIFQDFKELRWAVTDSGGLPCWYWNNMKREEIIHLKKVITENFCFLRSEEKEEHKQLEICLEKHLARAVL